jgi:hypothetical protein
MLYVPFTRWQENDRITVNEEAFQRGALDEFICRIQRSRRARCQGLLTLLAALCSAEWIEYREAQLNGMMTSLLKDILGVIPTQDKPFRVDRRAVGAYRELMQDNLDKFQQALKDLLES